VPTPYGMPFFVHACDVGARVGEKLECISGPTYPFLLFWWVHMRVGLHHHQGPWVQEIPQGMDWWGVGCVCVAMSNLCRLIG
jgi:hypothetical protein